MEIKETSIPYGYEACLPCDCPQRNHCLRAWAWSHQTVACSDMSCSTPTSPNSTVIALSIATIPHSVMPFGFTNFQQRMYLGQYQQFMSACIDRFGRNPYFMRRRGDTPLPPSEQAFIRSVLKQVGAPSDLDFDAFEERINWNDD